MVIFKFKQSFLNMCTCLFFWNIINFQLNSKSASSQVKYGGNPRICAQVARHPEDQSGGNVSGAQQSQAFFEKH